MRMVLNLILGIILSIANVISYKQDIASLATEIPLLFLLLISTVHLTYINTLNSGISTKFLYYACSCLVIVVFRLLHQKDVQELAVKENNYLLYHYSKKYFRISGVVFFILFFALIFSPFKSTNFLTNLCIGIVSWVLNIPIVGKIIPWFAIILLLGTVVVSMSFLSKATKKKNRSTLVEKKSC